MSYIDAFLERDKDRINVVERKNGERHFKTYPTRYIFYYPDPAGEYKSIYGNRLSRFSTNSIISLFKLAICVFKLTFIFSSFSEIISRYLVL